MLKELFYCSLIRQQCGKMMLRQYVFSFCLLTAQSKTYSATSVSYCFKKLEKHAVQPMIHEQMTRMSQFFQVNQKHIVM